MRKMLIGVVVLLLLFPLIPIIKPFLPKAVTFDRAKDAFNAAGLTVESFNLITPGGLGSVESASMSVKGAYVSIYHFDGEGKIALQLAYQKDDPGTAIVASWGLAESLGAAKSKNIPSNAVRNGKFMLTVASEDRALRQQVVRVFKKL